MRRWLPVICIGVFCLFTYHIYNKGYHAGILYAEAEYALKSSKLEEHFQVKLKEYQDESNITIQELQQAVVQYKEELAFVRGNADSRLLQSEQRASVYRKQARDSEAQRRALAEHTARLDKALTEGTLLVKGLTEHIKFRDKQLNSCTKLLIEERKLYGTQ